MSLRRKSCETCFKARRKCDLTYPVCKRCQKNQKVCQYISVPPTNVRDATSSENGIIDWSLIDGGGWSTHVSEQLRNRESADLATVIDFSLYTSDLTPYRQSPRRSDLLGDLGEVKPVTKSAESWRWVVEKLKDYPWVFAQEAAIPFIHQSQHQRSVSQALRTAFGICAASTAGNGVHQSFMRQVIDTEVSELLQLRPVLSIHDDLPRAQALLLYQLLDLSLSDHGQIFDEKQVSAFKALLLQLLQRIDTELPHRNETLDSWIIAESVRRTVLLSFLSSAIRSIAQHGVCLELPSLAMLPVSLNAAPWSVSAASLDLIGHGGTVKYAEFTDLWLESPPRSLDAFEHLIIVACKGVDKVEAYMNHDRHE